LREEGTQHASCADYQNVFSTKLRHAPQCMQEPGAFPASGTLRSRPRQWVRKIPCANRTPNEQPR
jgi:hypothetical protein